MPNLFEWNVFYYSKRDSLSRQEVCNEIWRRYHKRLFYFIQSAVGGNAEDLLQEIMLKVFKNMEKYNPFYSFNTWIYTIARNHCINHMSKRRLETRNIRDADATDSRFSHEETPEKKLIEKEVYQKIDDTLEQLKPDYRQMAFLHFYEGMKTKEIAKIMAVPTGTIKSRLYLIRRTLKKTLEAYNAY